jgi:hypothetical protein
MAGVLSCVKYQERWSAHGHVKCHMLRFLQLNRIREEKNNFSARHELSVIVRNVRSGDGGGFVCIFEKVLIKVFCSTSCASHT